MSRMIEQEEQVQINRMIWLDTMRRPGMLKCAGTLEIESHHPRASGRSPQNFFCALGVAAREFSADERSVAERRGENGRLREYLKVSYGKFKSNTSDLPDSAAKALNIDRRGRFYKPLDLEVREDVPRVFRQVGSIQGLNDKTSLPLSEIADVIQEQFDKGNILPYSEES